MASRAKVHLSTFAIARNRTVIFRVAAQREGQCPNFRTTKGARPNACAWPARPRTRPTKLCWSKWRKPGPGSPNRTKPKATTRNRNSPASQPQPGILIFAIRRNSAPWSASLNKKPSQTQPALRDLTAPSYGIHGTPAPEKAPSEPANQMCVASVNPPISARRFPNEANRITLE